MNNSKPKAVWAGAAKFNGIGRMAPALCQDGDVRDGGVKGEPLIRLMILCNQHALENGAVTTNGCQDPVRSRPAGGCHCLIR
jgi:hypothetical protein